MSDNGCRECWSENAEDAWHALAKTRIRHYLIDESHYIVSIRTCEKCEQSYLQVTTETVDWENGEDPISRTVMPLHDNERDALLAATPPDTNTIESIGVGRRSIYYDWPKAGKPTIRWSTGIFVGPHD